jgi:hypothetical protein
VLIDDRNVVSLTADVDTEGVREMILEVVIDEAEED